MRKLKQKILYYLIGAFGGLTAMLPLARCGGHCTTCFGCGGLGLGVVVVLIAQKIRRGKERSDGRI